MIVCVRMATLTINPIHHGPEAVFGRAVAFGMHTVAVYVLALRISPSLIGYGARFVLRFANFSLAIPAADWYLQHLEVVTIVPALVAGYLVVRRPNSIGSWAWCIPCLVLLYRIATYNPAVSALVSPSFLERLTYFFVIQHVMPTLADPLASDPERVAAQMFVTAPFYAGLAYSISAFAAKRKVVQKLFTFDHPPE